MAQFIPPPGAPPEEPVPPQFEGVEPADPAPPRAIIMPQHPRNPDALEAWVVIVDGQMMKFLYVAHPQDAYDYCVDVMGCEPGAHFSISRIPSIDRLQPDKPDINILLDDLGMFSPCLECEATINADRVDFRTGRGLDPVYYEAMGLLFCCPDHRDTYMRDWRKSCH